MKILIKNGRVIDPHSNRDGIFDILIIDDIIERVDISINEEKEEVDKVIDATGFIVMSGFIDMHVHFREPGYEHKETIATGSRAAAHGGFTSVCAMPNTNPVTDNKQIIERLRNKAKEEACVNVYFVGAVTVGQQGEQATDIPSMVEAGAIAISEDGKTVMDTALYKNAMIEAKKSDITVLAHCEDKYLVGDGVINKGNKSEELKLSGISNDVEDTITARDILLSKSTGVRLHLCHCSTNDSVKLIKLAKECNLNVTAEVCPHHFTLTEEDITMEDTNYKMNPPLRTKQDVLALKEGLKHNIIDVIATDHAPHHESEKAKPMKDAPFGIVGLETALPLVITELVDKNYLTFTQMAEKLSYNPAKILGIDRGTLAEGKIADIVIFDPNVTYEIDINSFVSKSKNTPFHGRKVKGRVLYTLVSGRIVYNY